MSYNSFLLNVQPSLL